MSMPSWAVLWAFRCGPVAAFEISVIPIEPAERASTNGSKLRQGSLRSGNRMRFVLPHSGVLPSRNLLPHMPAEGLGASRMMRRVGMATRDELVAADRIAHWYRPSIVRHFGDTLHCYLLASVSYTLLVGIS